MKPTETPHRPLAFLQRLAALAARTALLLAAILPASASVTEAWIQRYSNDLIYSNDRAAKVVRDAAGDFMVVGANDDGRGGPGLLVVKYSGTDGVLLWRELHYTQVAVSAVAVDAAGNLAVTGSSGYLPHDYYTARFAGVDGSLLWERHFAGPEDSDDIAFAVAMDEGGNVVVTGASRTLVDRETLDYNNDSLTIKYSAADGMTLWEKRYDAGDDHGHAVAVDGSGNVLVAAFSNGEFYTAKYAAANAALLWERRNHRPDGNWDFPNAIALDAGGNVVVTGSVRRDPLDDADIYTAKYAGVNGAFLWERRYDGPFGLHDYATALVLDGVGNVAVTGASSGGNGLSDFYTAKYAAVDGAPVWDQRFEGAGNGVDIGTALALDPGGHVIVTGSSIGWDGPELYTAKYSAANGSMLWDIHGPVGGSVATATNGDVVVTGHVHLPYSPNYTLIKYASTDGALVWTRAQVSTGNKNDFANAVAVDAAGNVLVTGVSDSASGTTDWLTAKYAPVTGALLWEKRYNGPANWHDEARAVKVDGNGNVIVTGHSTGATSYPDLYTAKYAAADGALLWERRYDGPAQFSDIAKAVVVDAGGNVVVTGTSSLGYDDDGYEYLESYTAKYAAADGALLWEKHSPGAAVAVALDPAGNVAITGQATTSKFAAADGTLLWETNASAFHSTAATAVDSYGNVVVAGTVIVAGTFNYYTAKYAAATGALLWEKIYDGPSDGNDLATAVALDPAGNVIVTGSAAALAGASATADQRDYYTAKYAAVDGALLWEKRRPGMPGYRDAATAVAVDGSGNVVVTGHSHSRREPFSEANRDFYTASYSAGDGTLLWEKRYNGAANGDDFLSGPHSLALGQNGMVVVAGSSDGNFLPHTNAFDYAIVVYLPSVPPVSFAAWAASLGLAGAAAAADADPDNDGLPNGVEYVLGENPLTSATAGASASTAQPSVAVSGGNMLFTFLRDDASETPDVSVRVENGMNLIAWPGEFIVGANTAGSSPGVMVSENGTAPDTVTVAIPMETTKAMFARLKITIAP